MNQTSSLQASALNPRSLTGALDRLRNINERLSGANDRTREFLDVLVGQQSSGNTTGPGKAISTPSFVSDLHEMIDGLEAEVRKTSEASFELIGVAGRPGADSSRQFTASQIAAQFNNAQRSNIDHAAFGNVASLG